MYNKKIYALNAALSYEWLNDVGKIKVQNFQNSFAKAFDIGLCFLDLDGKPLTVWSNSSLSCCHIYQENKERCRNERKKALCKSVLYNKVQQYTCFMGRSSFSVPVVYKKKIVAVVIGSIKEDLEKNYYDKTKRSDFLESMYELLENSLALFNKDDNLDGKSKSDYNKSEVFLLRKKISKRELKIMAEVSHGHSNKEIAAKLNITEATVKTHITNILHKLTLKDRIEIILYLNENEITL